MHLSPQSNFRTLLPLPPKNSYPLSSHSPFSSLPSPWQPPVPFLSLWICLFWTFHIDGLIHYVIFCAWLLSLCVMFSRFMHVVGCVSTSFFFTAEWYSIVWVYHILFIHLSILRRIWSQLESSRQKSCLPRCWVREGHRASQGPQTFHPANRGLVYLQLLPNTQCDSRSLTDKIVCLRKHGAW